VVADEDCGSGFGEGDGGEEIDAVVETGEEVIAGSERAGEGDLFDVGVEGERVVGHGGEGTGG
jgi:hypothetical protein